MDPLRGGLIICLSSYPAIGNQMHAPIFPSDILAWPIYMSSVDQGSTTSNSSPSIRRWIVDDDSRCKGVSKAGVFHTLRTPTSVGATARTQAHRRLVRTFSIGSSLSNSSFPPVMYPPHSWRMTAPAQTSQAQQPASLYFSWISSHVIYAGLARTYQ